MATRLSRGRWFVTGAAAALALGASVSLSCGLDAVGTLVSGDAGDVAEGSVVVDVCRGVTGCANPACPCTDAPRDWTVVAVIADIASAADGGLPSGAPCPEGWTNARWLRANPHASATCTCTCGAPSSNPCANGTMAVKLDGNLMPGDDFCNDGTATLGTDGGCQAVDFTWNTSSSQWAGISAPPRPPANVPCKDETRPPPIADDGSQRTCDAPAGPPVPKPPGALRVCVLHAGDEPTCPAGFSVRRVLADDVTDTRTCAACDCNTNATSCATPQVTFYTDVSCSQNARVANIKDVSATTNCERIQGSLTTIPTRYKYSATAIPSDCVPKTPTAVVSGTVAAKSTSTLCCPP